MIEETALEAACEGAGRRRRSGDMVYMTREILENAMDDSEAAFAAVSMISM